MEAQDATQSNNALRAAFCSTVRGCALKTSQEMSGSAQKPHGARWDTGGTGQEGEAIWYPGL